MNKTNYITIGALVFAVIALGVGLLIHAPVVNVQPAVCPEGQSDCLGATPGPNVSSNYFSVGGRTEYSFNVGMNKGTTTVCSIKAPSASSTLAYMTVKFTTSSSTASTVQIGKARSMSATTTVIGGIWTIDAGEPAFIRASTTPATETESDALNFTPGQYLNVNMVQDKEGDSTKKAAVGSCVGIFYLHK